MIFFFSNDLDLWPWPLTLRSGFLLCIWFEKVLCTHYKDRSHNMPKMLKMTHFCPPNDLWPWPLTLTFDLEVIVPPFVWFAEVLCTHYKDGAHKIPKMLKIDCFFPKSRPFWIFFQKKKYASRQYWFTSSLWVSSSQVEWSLL